MEMRISFSFPEGTGPQAIAAKLRFQAGLIEGMEPKAASSRKNTDGKAPYRKAAAAPVEAEESLETASEGLDDQESFDLGSDEGVEETLEETLDDAAAKKAAAAPKLKKVTIAEVNDACKARAKAGGKKGREQVLAILKKHFKTESVSEIKPELYGEVLQAMAVAQ
jgi:hypothetical protein